MKKKLLALLMAASMLALVACGGGSSSVAEPAADDTTDDAVVDTADEADEADDAAEADDGAAGDVAPTGEARTFRLADNHPDGYPTVMGDQYFADLVNERTGGAITIEVYNNAVLGDEKTAVEQTQMGDIQFIRVGTNLLSTINPEYNALSMPFLYRDKAHMWDVLDGEIGDEFQNMAYDQGLLGLCWFDSGSRSLYTDKLVETPEDMAGLKIRVQETALMMDLITYMGGSPTPMAYDEIYSGVQNGIINGAENNWPSYMSQSHNEVAPFFTVTEHVSAPEMILVNTGVWEELSAEEQAIVKQAALEAAEFERAEWAAQEKDYEDEAVASGVTVTYLTPEQKQVFVDAVAPLYEDAAYADLAEWIEKIRAA